MSGKISPNTLAFIALSNEYCHTLESARQMLPEEFVGTMVRLLPRLYMAASDLSRDPTVSDMFGEAYLETALDEDYYESIRLGIEQVLGAQDTYLEVFEQDMKYSDTPIGASIAESLADIFQPLYNFLEMVRDAPEDLLRLGVSAVVEEFQSYWSQRLCNVMRPLNHIFFSPDLLSDGY